MTLGVETSMKLRYIQESKKELYGRKSPKNKTISA